MGLIMSDKELVRKLYIDLCEASINKDLIKLDEILSDDYVLVHMTGMKQTKEDYLDSVKSGELSYFESKHESIDVNLNRDDINFENKSCLVFGKGKKMREVYFDGKAKLHMEELLDYGKT